MPQIKEIHQNTSGAKRQLVVSKMVTEAHVWLIPCKLDKGAGILFKIPTIFLQNSKRSHQILQEYKKKGPFLGRSCKSILLGYMYKYLW